MEKAKPKDIAGCLGAVLALFVSCPMWLVLIYGILSAVNTPGWTWALFWCYVPTQICLAVITGVMKILDE